MLNLADTNDQAYLEYLSILEASNIGKFEDIKKLLANDEKQAAINKANSITANNLIYQNLKSLALLFANNLIHSDSIPTDSVVLFTLNELADQDPTLEGEAVFIARAILRKDVFASGSNLKQVKPKVIKNSIAPLTITVYPNPTTGEFQLSCTQEYNNIEITNYLGKAILSIPITNYKLSEAINLNVLPNGLYLIKLYSGRSEIAKTKIEIIK